MKVRNLVLRPDRRLMSRSVGLDRNGLTLSHSQHKEAQIAVPGENCVFPDTKPVNFKTWADFTAHDTPSLVMKSPSLIDRILGNAPFLYISSAGIPFPQLRKSGKRSYADMHRLYEDATQAAIHDKGISAATKADMQMIPTMAMLGVALASLVSAIAFLAVMLPFIKENFF